MKKIFRYIIIFIPFLLGIILFLFNIINLFSSLCLFLGGYIFCKNTLDYRVVNKNKKYFNNNINYKKEDNNIHVSCIKVRNRERVRVRKK